MKRRPWWDRVLCSIGSHDWRNMDGVCASCGYVDPLWHSSPPPHTGQETDV